MRLLPAGPDAVLIEVASADEATALYSAVREAGLDVRDVVPAARTVLLDGVADRDAAEALLTGHDLRAAGEAMSEQRSPVEVPVTYDGEDLDDVARLWDMTRDEVVRTHTGAAYHVAFLGFAPGFAYCTGLPERLAVPRLDSPRSRVPAGSVGLAGEFTGIYPKASPGGWRLVARTDLELWDSSREPPATLTPGTPVRFVDVRT